MNTVNQLSIIRPELKRSTKQYIEPILNYPVTPTPVIDVLLSFRTNSETILDIIKPIDDKK